MEKFIKFWKQTWSGFKFLLTLVGLMVGGAIAILALGTLIAFICHFVASIIIPLTGIQTILVIVGVLIIIMVSHELGR